MSAPLILDELRTAATTDPAWATAVGPTLDDATVGVHLAVMVEPFLSLILDGTKTIESRLSKNAIAPYRQVSPGDLVLLKAGPVVGSFTVNTAAYTALHDGDLGRVTAGIVGIFFNEEGTPRPRAGGRCTTSGHTSQEAAP